MTCKVKSFLTVINPKLQSEVTSAVKIPKTKFQDISSSSFYFFMYSDLQKSGMYMCVCVCVCV